MPKVFRPGQRVKIISLPWRNYGDGVVSIGDIVTIHYMRAWAGYYPQRFAVLKELLLTSPQHNIGTDHLELAPFQSRNKREGKYLINRKGV